MLAFIKKELPFLLLGILIIAYSLYFSVFTILRNEKMYAHYFDLGIMHQTVHNTYKALQTGDMSRFLELTNPHDGADQVKRMAIHNDIFLAFLAPFYFIHDGPETLLTIQSLGVAFGALFIFLIAEKVLINYNKTEKRAVDYAGWLAFACGFAYLLYPPIQKANAYEFHAVTLAPTLLLGMYYFWMIKRYVWVLLFGLLAIFTKEQVGLVTGVFALYVILNEYFVIPPTSSRSKSFNVVKTLKKVQHDILMRVKNRDKEFLFISILGLFSIVWVVLSMMLIIPGFRGETHFGSDYYSYLIENPLLVFPVLFRAETFLYLHQLFSPLWYLPIFSPIHLAIAIPEFAVVLLSAQGNMRNTYFHYHTVLTAFIFLATIYGLKNLQWLGKKLRFTIHPALLIVYIIMSASIASYQNSSLPWAKHGDGFPWKKLPAMTDDMRYWREYLADDSVRVSTTGRLAPHFTSRRYFYDFSWKYINAEYVLIDTHEVQYGYLKRQTIPAYEKLKQDKQYVQIYTGDGLEVYKNINVGF